MIHIFFILGNLVSTFWEVWETPALYICGIGLKRLKIEDKKGAKERQTLFDREKKILALGDLARSSNKALIETRSFFPFPAADKIKVLRGTEYDWD